LAALSPPKPEVAVSRRPISSISWSCAPMRRSRKAHSAPLRNQTDALLQRLSLDALSRPHLATRGGAHTPLGAPVRRCPRLPQRVSSPPISVQRPYRSLSLHHLADECATSGTLQTERKVPGSRGPGGQGPARIRGDESPTATPCRAHQMSTGSSVRAFAIAVSTNKLQ